MAIRYFGDGMEVDAIKLNKVFIYYFDIMLYNDGEVIWLFSSLFENQK